VSLAWSTVALLVLLLPGFLFFVGLYLPERISRDVIPGGTLTQLGGIVLVSFFVHALLYVGLMSACDTLPWLPCISFDYALSTFSPDLKEAASPATLAQNISRYRWWILIYFLATSGIGLLVGLATGKLIVKGPLRFLAKHSWIYDLVDPDDSSFTLAYVLSNIRTDNRILMYRGFLQEYCFTPEGKISYLVLFGCSRYYLKMEGKKPITTAAKDWQVIGQSTDGLMADVSEKQWSYMVIEGEDIANVVFDRHSLTLTEEDMTQLKRE
jgi:hypothetical protein